VDEIRDRRRDWPDQNSSGSWVRKTTATVRVVARGMDKLARLSPDSLFEKSQHLGSDYMKPVCHDACKLQGLLGPPQMTAYDAGIGETLSWIAMRR
jgi:hypothetical protein